ARVSISVANSWGEGPMIHVRMLGRAEVLAGERRITPDSAMLFALALFLSVSAGQRVQRSRLLEMFWPDASDDHRRHALRQLLYRLRRGGFPLCLDGEELLVAEEMVESDIRCVLAPGWPEAARREDVEAAAAEVWRAPPRRSLARWGRLRATVPDGRSVERGGDPRARRSDRDERLEDESASGHRRGCPRAGRPRSRGRIAGEGAPAAGERARAGTGARRAGDRPAHRPRTGGRSAGGLPDRHAQ